VRERLGDMETWRRGDVERKDVEKGRLGEEEKRTG
jgi:hypothetical protein